MKLTGIIAEYNPFHMGHEYQLKMARENSDCDGIVVVMSGNYVQRGEPALIDKFKRAEAAVYGGADLVIELPLPFSCQNAEMFANAAINELKKLPVNSLSFGCETANADLLKRIARFQLSSQFHDEVKQEVKMGISYPSALANVIKANLGEDAFNAASSPNNVLGIEYIKCIMKHELDWEVIPVRRIGKDHNDLSSSGHYDSATAIRRVLLNSFNESVPSASMDKIMEFYKEHEYFNNINNYLDLLYYRIIELGPEGLKDIYEVNEGLNNKIYSNVYKHDNIDDFIFSLKSKRYTFSKLRRMLLNIILGITKDDIKYFMLTSESNYVKVLAFNHVGRNIIKEARSHTAIINRFSDYRKYNIDANEMPLFKLTDKATNMYYLPLKNKKFNVEYKANAVYVKI
jgi:predicted nucleotidyltransferase